MVKVKPSVAQCLPAGHVRNTVTPLGLSTALVCCFGDGDVKDGGGYFGALCETVTTQN